MGLLIKREAFESWEACAARYGKRHGLEEEVMAVYRSRVASGTAEADAAWEAVYEWDCCDIGDD